MTDDLEIKLKSFEKSKKEFFEAMAKKINSLAQKLNDYNLQDCEIVSEEEAQSCDVCGSTQSSLYIGPNGCEGSIIYEIDEDGDKCPITDVKEHLEKYIGCCHASTLLNAIARAEAYVRKYERKHVNNNADFSSFFEFN